MKIKHQLTEILKRQIHLGIFDLRHNDHFQSAPLSEQSIMTFANFRLDDIDVINNFEQILEKTQESNLHPLIFVLIGNFFKISKVSNAQDNQSIQNGISSFIEVLNKYRYFKDHCYWVMVPGTKDLGMNCMPKKPFPDLYFSKLREAIPHFISGTNPVRFTLLGKDVLISQMNLLKELRRG